MLTGMLPMLDSANPCDNALKLVSINFVLCCLFFTKKNLPTRDNPPPPRTTPPPSFLTQCIVHDMNPSQAIEFTGAQCSRQALHQRISRWRNSLAPPNLAKLEAIEAEWSTTPAISSRKSTAISSRKSTATEQTTPLSSTGLGERGGRKVITPQSIAPATLKAIADGPSWLDADKTLAAMSTRKRRTPSQVCRANFDRNAKHKYYRGQYSEAFKKATLELSESMRSGETKGRRGCGCGARAIAARINETMLTSPNDSKLKKSVLINAVQQKRAGLSPMKLGR